MTINGAAYEQVVQHNRALVQAQREAASMAPRTVVAPQHFVPVTQLEPDHVGVDIHLDT